MQQAESVEEKPVQKTPKISATFTSEPKLAINIVLPNLELLDKSLIFQMTFRDCKVTTQENKDTGIITITGSLAELHIVADKLNTTLFQPKYIETEAEKEVIKAELTALIPAVEAARIAKAEKTKEAARIAKSQEKTLVSSTGSRRNGFFGLKAKNTTTIPSATSNPKKKSSSQEKESRSRSNSLTSPPSVNLRRYSAPNPNDIDVIIKEHHNSPVSSTTPSRSPSPSSSGEK